MEAVLYYRSCPYRRCTERGRRRRALAGRTFHCDIASPRRHKSSKMNWTHPLLGLFRPRCELRRRRKVGLRGRNRRWRI
jgi:hypothetical protein